MGALVAKRRRRAPRDKPTGNGTGPGTLHPNAALADAIFRGGKKHRKIASAAQIAETRLSHIVRGRVVPKRGEKQRLARVVNAALVECGQQTITLDKLFPTADGR